MNVVLVVLVVTVVLLAVALTVLAFIDAGHEIKAAAAYDDTDEPTNAAPAPALDPQVPARARHIEPALRVHLCGSCGVHGVSQPGDWCEPCVYRTSPVHRAEEILREAQKREDAS